METKPQPGGRQRQADLCLFKVILVYRVSHPGLQKNLSRKTKWGWGYGREKKTKTQKNSLIPSSSSWKVKQN